MRIECTSSAEYVPSWDVWEVVREFAQNWRDACSHADKQGEVRYYPESERLRLWSPLPMERAAIITGYTTKKADALSVGEHGEGFSLACLVGVRCGLKITVSTRNERITPVIEDSVQFPGQRVLVFYVEPTEAPVEGTEVIIDGLDPEDFAIAKKRLRFFRPDDKEVTISLPVAEALTSPRERGNIYVGGIWVAKINSNRILLGYDFKPKVLKLDRDRRMVQTYDILYTISGNIIKIVDDLSKMRGMSRAAFALEVTSLDDSHDTIEAEAMASAARNNFTEEWDAFRAEVAAEWVARYGARAVPVTDSGNAAEYMGAVPIPTKPTCADLVEGALGGREKIKSKLLAAGSSPVPLDDLTESERRCLTKAIDDIQAIGEYLNLTNVTVMNFPDPNLKGLAHVFNGHISLARSALRSYGECVTTLAHEVAHIVTRQGDGTPKHTQYLERLLSKLLDLRS